MSNNVEPQARKNQLLKLVKEKNKHMFLLKNPVEFVFKPEAWIENAERIIGTQTPIFIDITYEGFNKG